MDLSQSWSSTLWPYSPRVFRFRFGISWIGSFCSFFLIVSFHPPINSSNSVWYTFCWLGSPTETTPVPRWLFSSSRSESIIRCITCLMVSVIGSKLQFLLRNSSKDRPLFHAESSSLDELFHPFVICSRPNFVLSEWSPFRYFSYVGTFCLFTFVCSFVWCEAPLADSLLQFVHVVYSLLCNRTFHMFLLEFFIVGPWFQFQGGSDSWVSIRSNKTLDRIRYSKVMPHMSVRKRN